MSCSCGCNPCNGNCGCDAANEALASVLNNLTTNLIGTVLKSCVDGEVVWVMPCDLDAGIAAFPKNAGESIACYFLRFMEASGTSTSSGLKGFRTTALSNANIDLVAHTDVQNQDFTGTSTAPVAVSMSTTGASAGDEFYLSLTNLVVTAINSLTIKSDATTLFTFNTAGTLNGFLKGVYTGTAWQLTLNSVNVT